jgi:hypothetical protein
VLPTKDEPSSKSPWKTTNVPAPMPLKTASSIEKETNVSKPTMARPTYI